MVVSLISKELIIDLFLLDLKNKLDKSLSKLKKKKMDLRANLYEDNCLFFYTISFC